MIDRYIKSDGNASRFHYLGFKKLQQDPSFATQFDKNMAFLVGDQWELVLKRKGSLLRGNQMYLFKILPSNLTIEQARELRDQRNIIVQAKSSFFKLLPDILAFIYVSERILFDEVVSELGNFDKAVKNFFGNVHHLNFLVETTNGTYLSPSKIGYYGFVPIKKLRNEVEDEIFHPFEIWIQSMNPIND